MCATMLVDEQEIPITQQRRQEFLEAYEFLGSLGERVLGFCDFDLPTADFPEGLHPILNAKDLIQTL